MTMSKIMLAMCRMRNAVNQRDLDNPIPEGAD